MTFEEQNKGKWVVYQAGILVRRTFDTRSEAEKWATWNYKNRANWIVRQL